MGLMEPIVNMLTEPQSIIKKRSKIVTLPFLTDQFKKKITTKKLQLYYLLTSDKLLLLLAFINGPQNW